MLKSLALFLCLIASFLLSGQSTNSFADSIRTHYQIPELAFAVLSADTIYEMHISGVQRITTTFQSNLQDKFRIGSNTKAITGFIAAQLVKAGKIKWDTQFFDLFPELKASSQRAHHQLTLLNLLSFRARLFPYTYTYAEPKQEQFPGNEAEQRYQFAEWFFQQKPVKGKGQMHFSNLGYIAAGLMLEKVSGKTYQQLVQELGQQLDINFGFGAPNTRDTLQPWGHDKNLIPEAPMANYKLNWLLAAGNINVSLPDYVKFIQLQLQGLRGQSSILSQEEFEFLHFGLPKFALGWFWLKEKGKERYAYNVGNPGTFLSKVYVIPASNRAFIFLTNAQTDATDQGLDVLYEELKRKYTK